MVRSNQTLNRQQKTQPRATTNTSARITELYDDQYEKRYRKHTADSPTMRGLRYPFAVANEQAISSLQAVIAANLAETHLEATLRLAGSSGTPLFTA